MSVDDGYLALIGSDRVSDETRKALLSRAEPDDPAYAPAVFDAAAFATLRALLALILPQDRVDLAARIDKALHAGESDGWRFAALAPDAQAYRDGLAAFAAFPALDDALLAAVAAGKHGERLELFFEDLRGRATMIYASHPSTFARIGYAGIAYGGDGARLPGFVALAAGEREAWEPKGLVP